MNALNHRLLEAMAPNLVFRSPEWGNPRAMSQALRDVRKTLSGEGADLPDQNVLQRSLHRFASTRTVANFTELKHVCYGVTVPVGENKWSLIDQEPLFHSLLQLVEQHRDQAKQYRRCYQGLLNGYFGFEKQAASSEGKANWTQLRSYLGQRLTPMLQSTAQRGLSIHWLQALSAHQNLLTDDPCSRYAGELQKGAADELRSLCGALGIASTSWVWDEALMAYVKAVCNGNDQLFCQDMSGVLNLLNDRLEMKLAQMLRTRAAAMTVARYARCADRPEHHDLRDTSLRCIGNPWVNRMAWDTHVQSEPARQMVEGWIKRRLIKDFFELMAHDGAADLRRLNYWLKREPEISDMWFVLGSDARNNRSAAFADLRERMSGRRRSLDDPNGQNNAFVMRIGPLLIIEFGAKGNACYAFAASDFKADLDRPLLSIHMLKQRTGETRLLHTGSWEPKFDYELRRLIQAVPSFKGELLVHPVAPPATHSAPTIEWGQETLRKFESGRPVQAEVPKAKTPLPMAADTPSARHAPAATHPEGPSASISFPMTRIIAGCQRHGILWEDNRPNNGAFWVLMQDKRKHPGFATLLEASGFSYAPGKGFWIKHKA